MLTILAQWEFKLWMVDTTKEAETETIPRDSQERSRIGFFRKELGYEKRETTDTKCQALAWNQLLAKF